MRLAGEWHLRLSTLRRQPDRTDFWVPVRLTEGSAESIPFEDSTGQTIDFLLTAKRDMAAAKRFLRGAIDASGNAMPR